MVDGYSIDMDAAPWTLEALTDQVDLVLERCGIRQENGQVAEAPNARAIRWYQSIGLLRRPVQRGRVAYYGLHHLAELVAIKRLQADGHSLSDVQGRLQAMDDAAVLALAAIPEALTIDNAPPATRTTRPAAFWDMDVSDAVVESLPVDVPAVVPASMTPVAPATSPAPARRLHDLHGVSLALPAHVADDVAQAILRGVVVDLVARGLLRATTPNDEPAR